MPRSLAGVVFLVVAAAVLTLAVWYPHVGSAEGGEPLVRPRGEACVEPVEVMRRRHMAMLYEWRDSVVRGDDPHRRTYVSSSGAKFEKSLTGTCLGCHESAQGFCDRCHERASVSVTCFQCHASVRADGDGREVPEASHSER